MTIGTVSWTQRGGLLTLGERWSVTLAAVRKLARLRREAATAGATLSSSILDKLDLRALEHIDQPWDALAFAASNTAQALQPQWLTNHGWRTYAWGTLLAIKGGMNYDKSLFFAACMLHDIGLTSHAALPSDQCFTLRSARKAADILRRAGASEVQVGCVSEAITLHLNLDVGLAQGIEAHLLQAGAGLDVVGQRSHEVPKLLQRAVVANYPRLGFKHSFCQCMQAQAEDTPNSRTGFYVRRLGFLDLIRKAPFTE